MAVLKGHTDYINSIAYEPEKGDLILSASDDQTGKLWDLETGQAVHTFHLASPGTVAPPALCVCVGGGGWDQELFALAVLCRIRKYQCWGSPIVLMPIQNRFSSFIGTSTQCCGSESGIQYIFNTWLLDPGLRKIGIRKPG
jgi:WD40 repeat protein